MKYSGCKQTVLLVGTDKAKTEKVYQFCKESFPEVIFMRTINSPPDDGKCAGLPLTNVLYDDPYGPFSRTFLLQSKISILYINENKVELEIGIHEKFSYYFSIASNVDKRALENYNKCVQNLLVTYEEESVAEYNSMLVKRKAKFRSEFEIGLENVSHNINTILDEHYSKWLDFSQNFEYPFFSGKLLNDTNWHETSEKNLVAYIFATASTFLNSGKRKVDNKLKNALCISSLDDFDFKEDFTHIFQNLNINFASSPMGYGDYLQRMERVYNLLTGFGEPLFYQSQYINPHVSDLDFSEFIIIDFDDISSVKIIHNYILEFEEFFYLLASDSILINNDVCYSLYLHKAYNALDYLFEIFSKDSFYDNVHFSNKVKLVKKDPDCFNVVYHLRRHDTSLALLEGLLPNDIEKKMGVKRPLLTAEVCDRIAETFFDVHNLSPNKINISLVSDGFIGLIDRYRKLCFFRKIEIDDSVVQYLNKLEGGLLDTESTLPKSHLIERCVGREKDKTIRSLDIIANADLVITSSGFAIVLSKIAQGTFINGFCAMKAVTSEDKFVEVCAGVVNC
jgi:hypothetical protein